MWLPPETPLSMLYVSRHLHGNVIIVSTSHGTWQCPRFAVHIEKKKHWENQRGTHKKQSSKIRWWTPNGRKTNSRKPTTHIKKRNHILKFLAGPLSSPFFLFSNSGSPVPRTFFGWRGLMSTCKYRDQFNVSFKSKKVANNIETKMNK